MLAGERVRIRTREGEFEGILIPRPGILDKGITVIKLDNGYNIGIDRKSILESIVLGKRVEKERKRVKNAPRNDLPWISIISLGGTIASKVDYGTGGVVADYTADDFLDLYPELERTANIRVKMPLKLMSEDMTPKDWLLVADIVAKEFGHSSGVVVTQGTDVLHFSTAALSFLLKDLPGPVIFTAGQRSIDRGSSDAYMNLFCSVAAAKMDISGVYLCMHGSAQDDSCDLLLGTRVRKMHSSRRDAFRPINSKPVATIKANGEISFIEQSLPKRGRKAVALKRFEEKIEMLYTYPNMDVSVVDHFIKKKTHGLVIVGTGLGNVPKNLFKKIGEANRSGMNIVITTQTIYGRTHELVYSNLRELSLKLGCIFVGDMLPEVAYVKLGVVIGMTRSRERIRELMRTPFAGEISDRSLATDYLI